MPLSTPFRHALPVAEHELSDAIHVTYAGWIHVEAGELYQSLPVETPAFFRYQWNEGRTLPEFCLVLIRDGEGKLETRQGIQQIPCETAFLLRPGEWHRHRPTPEVGWTNSWVAFNGNLPREWMRRNSFRLHGNIAAIGNHSLFLAQFERLLTSVHRTPGENTARLSCQLIGLLSHLLGESSDEEVHDLHEDEMVSKALAFIWGNVLESVTVTDVSDHLGCGRRSLERHFKEGTGRSLLEEIQACRIDRAKRLLIDTRIPLKECAARAGFNTSGHMRQVFRKQFGIAPETFREQSQVL